MGVQHIVLLSTKEMLTYWRKQQFKNVLDEEREKLQLHIVFDDEGSIMLKRSLQPAMAATTTAHGMTGEPREHV